MPESPDNRSSASEPYWDRRRDLLYLHASRQICERFAPEIATVLDVGSHGTPTLEWHRDRASRLVSVDLRRPYEAEGVESVTADFLKYQVDEPFDLVTCFQVLEHVPEVAAFAQKLLAVSRVLVVSVPYKWPAGSCRYHIHDPVDEHKMKLWFEKNPRYSYVIREIAANRARLIQVYDGTNRRRTSRGWSGTLGIPSRATEAVKRIKRVGRKVRRALRYRQS